MANDFDKQAALVRYLRRTKTAAEIKTLADQAFADVQAGVQLTNVGFEGGSGSGQVSCEPHNLLLACEQALLAIGDSDAVPNESQVVYSDFSGRFIET